MRRKTKKGKKTTRVFNPHEVKEHLLSLNRSDIPWEIKFSQHTYTYDDAVVVGLKIMDATFVLHFINPKYPDGVQCIWKDSEKVLKINPRATSEKIGHVHGLISKMAAELDAVVVSTDEEFNKNEFKQLKSTIRTPIDSPGSPKNQIAIIHAHGTYNVTPDGRPTDVFNLPKMRLHLIREAQPGFCSYGDYDQAVRLFKTLGPMQQELNKINSILPQAYTKRLLAAGNNAMCDMSIYNHESDNVDIKKFMDVCFNKMKIVTYEQGEKVVNKQYSMDEDACLALKIVDPEYIFSPANVLVPYGNGIETDLESICNRHALNVKSLPLTGDLYLFDFSCSAFFLNSKYHKEGSQFVEEWSKSKWGGKTWRNYHSKL